MAKRRRLRWASGCGFLLITCLVSCVLLVVDSAVVLLSYTFFAPMGPLWLTSPRIGQLIVLVGPVLLLVAQWWAYDRCVDFVLARWDAAAKRKRANP